MVRIITLLMVLFFLSSPGKAQIEGLKYGKLPNGLTYYVLQDKSAPGEAGFYLYQNVGAIVEKKGQYGLAHFLEHMAFNSTRHFKGGVMAFLRDKSLTFNAKTGVNDTRYQVNNVPLADTALADSVLLLLKDWCNGLSLLPKDVEKERKIISEEWRQTRNVDNRMADAIAPIIYNHSSYATHNVIGSEEDIHRYTAQDIKRFYQEWYRPELQCVMVIGDIDPAVYEQKVREVFGAIPASKVPVRQNEIVIPDNSALLTYHFVDKENVSNSMGLYQRCPITTDPVKYDLTAEDLKVKLFRTLAAQQFAKLRNESKEAYIAASMDYSPLVRAYAKNSWDIVPYAGKEAQALEQVLALREMIRRSGFESEEFEQEKLKLYNEMKALLENENIGTPDNWMEVFRENYLYGFPLESLRQQITRSMESLVEMEVGDLNRWVRSWMTDKNLAFVTYTSRPGDLNMSAEQVEALLKKVEASPVMSFERPSEIKDLIDFTIKPGKIVSEKNIEELGVKEWRLSNGARVLYKYLPEAGDRMYFAGSAMGGTSSVADKDLPSESAMQSLIMQSGLYKYDRNRLYRWLQGKNIHLSLSVTDYTDGIGGNVPVANVGDFFKYVYLVINRQNFDEPVFRKFVERGKYLFANRSMSGMEAIQDSIKDLLYPPTPSNPKEDLAFYDRMKYDDLKRLFNDRFGNAAYFTFCLIGNVPEAEARQLFETYIASLPGTLGVKPRTYSLRTNSSPEKDITRVFQADIEGDVGEVEISFINDKTLSGKEQMALKVLKELLQARLFDELREKEGGIYGASVDATYSPVPRPLETLKVHFSCRRDKADDLKQQVYAIIEEIRSGAVSDDAFKKVYVPFAVDREVERRQADRKRDKEMADPLSWLALLNAYAENGKVTQAEVNTPDAPDEDLTKKDISALMDKLLKDAKKRDITVKSLPPRQGTYH